MLFIQHLVLQTTAEVMLHALRLTLETINNFVDNQQTRVKSSSFSHTTTEQIKSHHHLFLSYEKQKYFGRHILDL